MRYYHFLDNTDQSLGMYMFPAYVTPDMVQSELRKFGNNVEEFIEKNTLDAIHIVGGDIYVDEEFSIERHDD